jgi:hypothetical protein
MAEQISDFTALTTPASGDLLAIVDVSDTTDAATGTTKKLDFDDLTSNLLGYTVYIPVVTQSGTATLGQTVLRNTTGVTPGSWVRSSIGLYYLDFTGVTGTFWSENYSNWTGNTVTKQVVKGDGTLDLFGSYFYWWDNGAKKLYLYVVDDIGTSPLDLNALIGTSELSLPEIRFYI